MVLDLEASGTPRSVANLDPKSVRNPALAELKPGDEVGTFDAWETVPGTITASDQTVVYKLPTDVL